MKEPMRQTALIVEDNLAIGDLLRSTLATAGIDSIHAPNEAAMWQQLQALPDIIILDLNLPDADGLTLLHQLRQVSDVPVLVHSVQGDDIDRIIGIDNGADDFMLRPGNMRELLARVRGLLRRRQRTNRPSRTDMRSLHFGAWTLDTASRQLIHNSKATTALGVSAYALLLTFLEHPYQTLSREHLSRVLKREYMPFDRIIDVHVSQIRRTLGKQADGNSFIKTLRSQGYVFAADVEAGP